MATRRRLRQTHSRLEIILQSFPRAALPAAEAHVRLAHLLRLGARGDARRDGADPRDLRHEWFRPGITAEGARLRAAPAGERTGDAWRLARGRGTCEENAPGGQCRAVCPGPGVTRVRGQALDA